ncbi:MAG: hypothetical protein ACK41O_00450 [Runella zeae]
MNQDDELKDFLGGIFKNFESEPRPDAWDTIEKALPKHSHHSPWSKTIIGVLVGVFCAGVCHAPVQSKWAEMKPDNATAVSVALTSKQTLKSDLFVPQIANQQDIQHIRTQDNRLSKKRNAAVDEKITSEPELEAVQTLIADDSHFETTPISKSTKAPLELQSLAIHGIENSEVELKTPIAVPSKSQLPKSLWLWSVSVMPLATYQRMYILPEASGKIEQVYAGETLNGSRTGLKIGTELTLLRNHSAWRVGLSYTQMRQRTAYAVATNEYTLSTNTTPNKPLVSRQIEEEVENKQLHLLGIRVDKQFNWGLLSNKRYFIGLGAETAVDMLNAEPYVWGHASIGFQKILTPHLLMTVEPTASYSIISKTTTSGLLKVNPYNFGLKISLGLMP